ncbi:aspartate 1-decarboxylase [Halorutilales archaeon Cl-col2-1]
MQVEKFKSKIHRATITETDLSYEGSITVGRDLLEAAGISEYERVQVVNVTNGERFETYTIEGEDGEICTNGAAARLGEVGDTVIIISYGVYAEDEDPDPTVIKVDDENQIV